MSTPSQESSTPTPASAGPGLSGDDDAQYLRRILNAQVYDVAIETPLEPAPLLSERIGNQVLLKREDLQEVFSFKLRGAYNKMAQLSPDALERGVIAASAGNHAQGVALAANEFGCRAVIVMPTTTPQLKIDAVVARGAEIVLHGESFSEANAFAQQLMEEKGLTYVHPFDDPDVIAGQGTVGMEILRQHGRPIHAIFVAVGGGGLIAGIAAYVKQVRPDIKVIGVQHEDSTAMAQSLAAGHRVELTDVGLFADGTAVKKVGEETFRMASKYVDEMVIVDTDETCAAIKDVFTETRTLLEPAGALAIAGAKKYAATIGCTDKTLVAVSCGANMNFDRLRFVAERADIGEQREAVFAVTIPERPGSFREFCEVVGARNVTEFNYRISDSSDAHVFVGVSIGRRDEATEIAASFEAAGFATIDLTDDELAKVHIRHLVGGKSPIASDELLHRYEFPERPGALMQFLNAMNPEWNISLFHYRNQGSDHGRVLVGMQVPAADHTEFDAFRAALGYRSWDETQNPAYRLFL
ncbi:threonine ammonia-lyase, biosynthetic [Ilumatobacter coccineus]|uniref:L-threonine dehydratase n=1 Tax=Ilumatobacter coccineus (strain NBRC 103263 / KCTC 29153 / YM16-304) TaxID=1313172 RepID=A0A6C7E7T5_ILUCY|nr:threonine ammonia-lyase, biosynthetic [Ilumatobacter coccineus]BAN03724.1 threonine dehydratase [Ilumatobacter coccineus YM16-304]